jgi:chorismate synthase
MGNVFGRLFRLTTFGESHGAGVGCVIDGCPPRLELGEADIQRDLDRRRPGLNRLMSARQEEDRVEILSGVFEGKTLGSPIALLVRNQDARPQDYDALRDVYRPSHADFTQEAKYGIRNWRGGGRVSARETVGRVAGGAVARQLLHTECGVEIVSCVERIHSIRARVDPAALDRDAVEASLVRCPDPEAAAAMEAAILAVRTEGDSLGGVILGVVRGAPAGWGAPVFGKIEADLAAGMLSIPAVKGFEIGSGFAGTEMKGSEHNDAFRMQGGRVRTETNRSGGVQGGITNGEDIVFRVAFKPTATIRKPQRTVTRDGQETTVDVRGRHDPCVLPRAVPIVEAMAALVLADHYLRHRGQTGRAGAAGPGG